MRFKQYLTEEYTKGIMLVRSETISEQDAFKLIKTKCKKAFNAYIKGHKIFRGLQNHDDYMFIDPKKHVRVSRNTDNYYTLLMDNLPSWEQFPKRSQSIICSSGYKKANMYGTVYEVFPYDGSNIGIASKGDIWDSFYNTFDNRSLSYFNLKIKNLGYYQDVSVSDIDIDYRHLIDYINDAEKSVRKEYKLKDWDTLTNGWDMDKSLLSHIEGILDPKKNGITHTTNLMKLPKNREVWTDGKCVLIKSMLGGAGGLNPDLIEYMEK